MQVYRWTEVPKLQLNPLTTRQVIHGESITIARFETLKGSLLPEHSHHNEQFSSIEKGAVQFVIGGQQIVLRAGESVRIPPNVPHSAVVLEDAIAIDTFSPPRDDWR
jgi:quercetin dioxygenase-like cupin family protein